MMVNKKANHFPSPIRVMIVDDSFLMRNVIKSIVNKDESFVVIAEAGNGEEALAALESNAADIILLDIEMPVMDGIEFLKKSRFKTNARIIVISSIVTIDSPKAREILSLGASDFINKPSGVLSMDLEKERSIEILDALHRCAELLPQ